VVQGSLGKSRELIAQIIRIKRAGGMAIAVGHLPSKHKTLSSIPSTIKKKSLCLSEAHIPLEKEENEMKTIK
jgi:hypothetical protein